MTGPRENPPLGRPANTSSDARYYPETQARGSSMTARSLTLLMGGGPPSPLQGTPRCERWRLHVPRAAHRGSGPGVPRRCAWRDATSRRGPELHGGRPLYDARLPQTREQVLGRQGGSQEIVGDLSSSSRESVTIQWTRRENVRGRNPREGPARPAAPRVPPDKQAEAAEIVRSRRN
jgi:hypothetical protein